MAQVVSILLHCMGAVGFMQCAFPFREFPHAHRESVGGYAWTERPLACNALTRKNGGMRMLEPSGVTCEDA